jgi:hypothetical protein
VPLSEHEQRILEQIERSFYEHDPVLAGKVSHERADRRAGRRCRWGLLWFAGGLALLLATFSTSLVLGALGFLIMLGSSIYVERHVRLVARAGWAELSGSIRGRSSAREPGVRLHFRDRFRQE